MRRDLLASGLKAVQQSKQQPPEDTPQKVTAGVRSVARGLSHLSSGAPQPIDTAQIADSAIKDRFSVSEGIGDLVTSIDRSGQKLPVLLRRVKGAPLPYEVVYGRRRIEACRQLGRSVLAYITEMSDRDALISQGLENAARLQRSFIEQAIYAQRLMDHDLSREEIMDVLAVDETTISRMLSVCKSIPAPLIDAIGPAHDAGRRPWIQLRAALGEDGAPGTDKLLSLIDTSLPSSERLQALLRALSHRAPAPAKAAPVRRDLLGGKVRVERKGEALTVKSARLAGFSEFLERRMQDLVEEFQSGSGGKS